MPAKLFHLSIRLRVIKFCNFEKIIVSLTSSDVHDERMLVEPFVKLFQCLIAFQFCLAKLTFSNFHKLLIHNIDFEIFSQVFFLNSTRLLHSSIASDLLHMEMQKNQSGLLFNFFSQLSARPLCGAASRLHGRIFVVIRYNAIAKHDTPPMMGI